MSKWISGERCREAYEEKNVNKVQFKGVKTMKRVIILYVCFKVLKDP